MNEHLIYEMAIELTKVELIVDHQTCFASVIQHPFQVTHIVALVHPIHAQETPEETKSMTSRSLLSYLIQSSGYIIHYYPSLEISMPLCSESLHFQVETFEHLDFLFVLTRNALKVRTLLLDFVWRLTMVSSMCAHIRFGWIYLALLKPFKTWNKRWIQEEQKM